MEFFCFYLKILQQMKDFIPNFWAKNDWARSFFVDEVNIRDFRRGQNSTFWPNFNFSDTGLILGELTPFFFFYLKILQQIKNVIPNILTQHLEQPISVHMPKKWGELGQKWPS